MKLFFHVTQFWIAQSGVVCMLWWDLHVAADAEMRDVARKCHVPPPLIYMREAATGTFDAHRDGKWHLHTHRWWNLLWITLWAEKTRQRWRVFAFIYSAAYCLFAQLHVANARQNADQLPHHSADSIVSLSGKPARVFYFIFLYSLVSEQVPVSLILPSPFLNVFLFFIPQLASFLLLPKAATFEIWPTFSQLIQFCFYHSSQHAHQRSPKTALRIQKGKKKKNTRTCLSKDALFLFRAAQELAAEMVSKEDFKSGGLLRNASLGDTRTFALY